MASKTRVRRYVPAFGIGFCASSRAEVLAAIDVASSVKMYGRSGKEPVRIGAEGFTDSLPIGFREAVEDAFRVIVGTFECLESSDAAAAWAQRETLRVAGNNVSLRAVLATYLGESTGLSAGQIRKAAGLEGAKSR